MVMAAFMACILDGVGATLAKIEPVAYRLFEPPRQRRLQMRKHPEPLS